MKNRMIRVHSGMSRHDALDLLVELGGIVCHRRGTGEVICSHPKLKRTIVHNNRRKDASRVLTTALKYIMNA